MVMVLRCMGRKQAVERFLTLVSCSLDDGWSLTGPADLRMLLFTSRDKFLTRRLHLTFHASSQNKRASMLHEGQDCYTCKRFQLTESIPLDQLPHLLLPKQPRKRHLRGRLQPIPLIMLDVLRTINHMKSIDEATFIAQIAFRAMYDSTIDNDECTCIAFFDSPLIFIQ